MKRLRDRVRQQRRDSQGDAPRSDQPAESQARRLIFVSLVFHPDTSASSILFSDLFRRLATPEVQVTVLCGFPSKDRDAGRELPRRDRLGAVEIIRCGPRLEGKRTIGTRALVYAGFLAHAGVYLLRRGRGATVVGGTDPPFTVVALWLYSLLGRFRYQDILLDAYPDGLVALGSLGAHAPVTRLWKALNRRAYRGASALVVIGRDMIDLLRREYGVDAARVRYVPHWGPVEVDAELGLNRRPLLADHGLSHKFVVQYSGNMGLWHDIDALVKVADRLQAETGIHFLFIGKGMRRAPAKALAHHLGLRNITWLDFVPRDRLADSLLSCDVALVSLRAGLAGVAVPSKLYGILAAGRAVIAQVPGDSEVALTIWEHQCGVVVDPGDVDALAAAITTMAGDPAETRRMGARARAAYERHYSLDQAVAAFQSHWNLPTT